MIDMPYFMENEEWYEFNFDKRIFVLTDKAPKKAQESYADYMNKREKEFD